MASCWMLFIVKFRSRLCSSLLAANSLGAEGGGKQEISHKICDVRERISYQNLDFYFFLILFSKGDGLKSEVQNRFLAMCIEMRSKQPSNCKAMSSQGASQEFRYVFLLDLPTFKKCVQCSRNLIVARRSLSYVSCKLWQYTAFLMYFLLFI